jgi:hypothetical protein
VTAAKRDRGAWASTPAAKRHRPLRGFNLPRRQHAVLDALVARGVPLSALVEEALDAHPTFAAELARQAELARLKKNDTPPEKTC